MRAIAILGLALGASSASAQDVSVYAGVALGIFDHDNPTHGQFSDSVSSNKFFGGLQLGQHFGFEAGYGSPNKIDAGVSGSPLNVATRFFPVSYGVDFTMTTVKAMGYLPRDWGALWIGYGTFHMEADVEFSQDLVGRRSLTVDDDGEMAALGVEWRFERLERSIALRLEYEWLHFPVADASTIALGVAYRFEGL